MLAYAPSVTAPRPGAHRLQVRLRFRSQYGCEVRLVTPRDSSKPEARVKSADQVLRRNSRPGYCNNDLSHRLHELGLDFRGNFNASHRRIPLSKLVIRFMRAYSADHRVENALCGGLTLSNIA